MNTGLQALEREGLVIEDGGTWVEQLVWTRVKPDERPDLDAEMTVLLKLSDGGVWQGYYDDDHGWCSVDTTPIAAAVLAYSDPKGPAA